MKTQLILAFVFIATTAFCQSVGLGTTTPDSSAILDLSSSSKGILIPRMTTVQRNRIESPATGLQVYNLDDSCLNIYDGEKWVSIGASTAAGNSRSANDTLWLANGQHMHSNVAGNVGVNVETPSEKFEVGGAGRAFFGNGDGPDRKGLLIDGVESFGTRIESYDYDTGKGMNLILNSVGRGRVGINTNAPAAMLHVQDSSVVFASDDIDLYQEVEPPVSGQGSRMMWFPSRSAFRAGIVTGNNWDKDSIGYSSVAFCFDASAIGNASFACGYKTRASGDNSFVAGVNTRAFGAASFAIGQATRAMGENSFASGYQSTASGNISVAFGLGTLAYGLASFASGRATTATGNASFASGFESSAYGVASFATGTTAFASGESSFASGHQTFATGAKSFASGEATVAGGENSTASGYYTGAFGPSSMATGNQTIAGQSESFASGFKTYANTRGLFAIGRYNEYTADNHQWSPADHLFVIGNGIDSLHRKNAVTVLKNGKVGINTSTPAAMLHVKDSSVVFGGNNVVLDASSYPPMSGSGNRMMWFPARAAFRAGIVNGNHWNRDSIGFTSFASGYNTKAIGESSFAAGNSTTASGYISSALGNNTVATGVYSFASGYYSKAIGSTSFVSGNQNTASGISSFAAGNLSTASGEQSASFGEKTTASARNSFAIGHNTTANTYGLFAIGKWNVITPDNQFWTPTDHLFVIGNGIDHLNRNNVVTVLKNGKVGINTPTPAAMLHVKDSSVVFASDNINFNATPHPPVAGPGNRMMWFPSRAAFRAGIVAGNHWSRDSIGYASFATGYDAKATGPSAFACGYATNARGGNSCATGSITSADGDFSFSSGSLTQAYGVASFAAGNATKAKGNYSFSTGELTEAVGLASIATGYQTLAGDLSFAGGNGTKALGIGSMSLGFYSQAIGYNSFASGFQTRAIGAYSHATGFESRASGAHSYVDGYNVKANTMLQFVIGRFNDTTAINNSSWSETDHLFAIGNGTNNGNRRNAFTVLKGGNVGISTSAPVTKLQVTGGTTADYSATSGFTVLGQVTSANLVIDDNEILARNNGAAANLLLQEDGGRVGIGVSSPNEKLEVGGDGRAFFGGIHNSNRAGILIDGLEGNASRIEAYNYGANTGRNLVFNTTGGGKVGIGTTTPSEKLDVNGNAHIENDLLIDGVIANESWHFPTLANGNNLAGNTYPDISFYRDKEKRVHLRGTYQRTNMGSDVIFTLDEGYRPAYTEIFVGDYSNGVLTGTCRILVLPNGEVRVSNMLTTATISINGISFRAE